MTHGHHHSQEAHASQHEHGHHHEQSHGHSAVQGDLKTKLYAVEDHQAQVHHDEKRAKLVDAIYEAEQKDRVLHSKSTDPSNPFGGAGIPEDSEEPRSCLCLCIMILVPVVLLLAGVGFYLSSMSPPTETTPEQEPTQMTPPRSPSKVSPPMQKLARKTGPKSKKPATPPQKFEKDSDNSDDDSEAPKKAGQSDSEGAAPAAPQKEERKFDFKAYFDSKDMTKLDETVIDWNKSGEREYYTITKKRFGGVKKVRNYAIDPLYRKSSFLKRWKKIKPGQEGQGGEDNSDDDSSGRRRLMSRLTRAEEML